ncbi:dihydroorotase [Robertkochia marina]|uniref:Dihydroorotase n=1 Tax=Robertkochia marina TaxID=1227945 RepID=A0A4S3M1C4_9FLAO|nr:dihydroorotase [Robertkochia marina]THD67837.1 dihydroorotase [Robertkochia marina]TRZ42124.1 dihydroorotase [Robertkochia marina]
MNILLRSVKIIDPQGKHNQQVADIYIKNGIIENIDPEIGPEKGTQIIEIPGLHVSPGWFDSSVSFGEPGFEERETIAHGLFTAARSGFTAVAVNPNTHPVADSNADMAFIKARGNGAATEIFPIGALTAKGEGVDLAELFDMSRSGAIAFGDYRSPVANPNLLKIALQYVQNFDGMVISFPLEKSIAGKGVVNEEETALRLGLKGIPALSEELQIARDLYILEYTGGKLHIPTISTKRSVELISAARKKGLDVTCSVAIHNLFLNDSVLDGFDTRYKTMPPLRTEEDRKALLKGLTDGVIDMVTSDHDPRDIEGKKVEFDYADYGTIGLESAFGALNTLLPLDKTISLLTSGRGRFKMELPAIEKGAMANLSLFDPSPEYVFKKSHVISTSANSAFYDQKLKGKVYGIIRANHLEADLS